jgi:lipopolysaccharide cholinephosphotransferase
MSFKSTFNFRKLLLQNTKGHYLEEEDIKKLQRCLVILFGEVLEVCSKYDIKPMLGGGCLIGYARHQGHFIP